MNQFDASVCPGDDLPVFIEAFKIIGEIELDIEVQIIESVIIAVAITDAPGTGECVAAIDCGQHIVASKSETKPIEVAGLIISFIDKRGDVPGAGLYSVSNSSLSIGIAGRIVIGTRRECNNACEAEEKCWKD